MILGIDEFKKTGRYFDPNAFSMPLAGTFGNVARGALMGPGFFNVNTRCSSGGVIRSTANRERQIQFALRLEF